MKLIRQVTYVISASTLLVGLAATPVFAHNGVDDGDSSGSTDSSHNSGSGSLTSSNDTTEHAAGDDKAKAAFQAQAKQKIDELRQTAKTRTKAAREDSCNTHKKGAEQRIGSISTNVNRFQTKLDAIFTKTQSYVTDQSLTIANYDTLVASVTSAQSASAESIATLSNLKPSIDCSQSTNAENVAAFRTAAQDSRDKLKVYMKSLKELLKAVRDGKKASATTTETQGSTN